MLMYRYRILSLQRSYIHVLSFEIIDIFWKMKLYSIANLYRSKFELFSKFEPFFLYKSLKMLLKMYYKKSKDFKSCDGRKVFVKL